MGEDYSFIKRIINGCQVSYAIEETLSPPKKKIVIIVDVKGTLYTRSVIVEEKDIDRKLEETVFLCANNYIDEKFRRR